jgi:calcineurin-like phosphoesterase family protein
MATYCCSDLHGQLFLYKAIKEFIKPEDTVFFLGDAGDRGRNSWETIKAIWSDEQFKYLRGNHEDMLVKAMEEYYQGHPYGSAYELLAWNGGAPTYEDWLAEKTADQRFWYNRLKSLLTQWTYVNAFGMKCELSHAGFTPGAHEKDLIWDRKHFRHPWPEGYNDTLIVHGHTPCQLMDEELLVGEQDDEREIGAYWYCDFHKVDLDNASFYTNACVLLDLDTFDEHIFQ